MLVFSHLARPENLHEIAGLRLIETIEVPAEPQFVKKARGARAVGVPSSPDAFAVALISNDQLFQGGIIEVKLPTRAQRLDRSNEDQICRARAETRRTGRRENKKFAGLEMRRSLQADLCEM